MDVRDFVQMSCLRLLMSCNFNAVLPLCIFYRAHGSVLGYISGPSCLGTGVTDSVESSLK